MFKSFIVLAAFALSSLAQAMIHPCTPTVQAQPMRLNCSVGPIFYTIRVNTLKSPSIPLCTGQNYYETSTAVVTVSDQQGKVLGKIEILDDSAFEFKLGHDQDGTFDSDAFSLHLDRCVSPINGGVSIGN